MIGCGRGSFELTGLDDERVIGRDVSDVLGLVFEGGDDHVSTVLEWGVRALGKPVQVNAEGDLPATATATSFRPTTTTAACCSCSPPPSKLQPSFAVTDRRRNLFVLLLVLGLLIASAAVLAPKPTKLGLDLQGGVELIYEAKPTKTVPVTPEALQEGDRRHAQAHRPARRGGAGDPADGRPPDRRRAAGGEEPRRRDQAGRNRRPARLLRLGGQRHRARRRPVPEDPQVTGGSAAGQIGSISLYEAVLRASKLPAKVEPNNSREDSLFYGVDPKTKKVYGSGTGSEQALRPRDARPRRSRRCPRRCASAAKVYEVKPNTVIVRAEQRPDVKEKTDDWFVMRDDVALEGKEIKNPEQQFDQGAGGTGAPNVTFEFTDKGRKIWQEVTREIADRGSRSVGLLPGQTAADANQHFAIVLDDELVSIPYIDFRQNPDGIDGRTGSQISGGFTIKSAQDLAGLLKTGALPLKLELIASSQVSATLGAEALDEGLIAGIAGFIIVALFLLAFYRVLGVIAVLAMAVYALYFFALIKLIPVTLTLPGIAGLILTLGVAADANIVIFERVKEEIRAGRSVMAGIATGYKKGLTAIIDANVVTIMVAFILFVLATAASRGSR